jgi:hypothetical protein
MANSRRDEFFSLSMDMSKIAGVLGRKPEELTGYRDPNETDIFRLKVLGHHLTANDLNPFTPKVCPECILEGGHIPLWSEFSIVDACPKHGRRFLTHCTVCNHKLSWLRPGLLVCRCNSDLSRMRGTQITSVHCEFLRQLVARIVGSEAPNKFAMPVDRFKAMTLSSVLGFSTAMSRIHRVSTNEELSIAEGAARVLLDWPNNFYISLGKVVPPEEVRNGYVHLRKHIEGVYKSISRDVVDAADVAYLRSVINQFTQSLIKQEHFSVKYSSDEINALEPVNDADSMTFAVSTESQRPPRIKKKRKATAPYIRTPWIPVEPGTRNFGARQAAKYIGLPTAVLTLLRRSGHFEACHRTVNAWSYHEKDLDAFIEKMTGLWLGSSPLSGQTDLVNFGSLMKLIFKFANGKGDLVVAMLDGRVPVLGCDGPGLRGLLVSRRRVDEFIEASRSKSFGDAWTEGKVGDVLHCDLSVVDALVRAGHLTGKRYVSGMRVDINSVQLFQAKFRSLASLAKEHGTTATTLVRLLKGAGINLLSMDRAGIDFKQCFIEVGDIPTFEEVVLPGLIDRRRKPFHRVTALDKLEAYFANLDATGEQLPRVGRKPHLTMIAGICGFERSVFYKDPDVEKAMRDFDQNDCRQRNILGPKEALEKYLEQLREIGESIPYCGSGPNLRTIAVQCGISRNDFYRFPELKIMVSNSNIL